MVLSISFLRYFRAFSQFSLIFRDFHNLKISFPSFEMALSISEMQKSIPRLRKSRKYSEIAVIANKDYPFNKGLNINPSWQTNLNWSNDSNIIACFVPSMHVWFCIRVYHIDKVQSVKSKYFLLLLHSFTTCFGKCRYLIIKSISDEFTPFTIWIWLHIKV